MSVGPHGTCRLVKSGSRVCETLPFSLLFSMSFKFKNPVFSENAMKDAYSADLGQNSH